VLGLSGVWGAALITWNAPIFYLAATAHILNLAFLQFVELPHMRSVSFNQVSEVPEVLRGIIDCPFVVK
jgi:phosphatidylethanolamine N-methyltransferase